MVSFSLHNAIQEHKALLRDDLPIEITYQLACSIILKLLGVKHLFGINVGPFHVE